MSDIKAIRNELKDIKNRAGFEDNVKSKRIEEQAVFDAIYNSLLSIENDVWTMNWLYSGTDDRLIDWVIAQHEAAKWGAEDANAYIIKCVGGADVYEKISNSKIAVPPNRTPTPPDRDFIIWGYDKGGMSKPFPFKAGETPVIYDLYHNREVQPKTIEEPEYPGEHPEYDTGTKAFPVAEKWRPPVDEYP